MCVSGVVGGVEGCGSEGAALPSLEQGKRAELRLWRWVVSTEDIHTEGPHIFAEIIPFTMMLQKSGGKDILWCANL